MAVTLQDHKGDPLEITNSTIGNAATATTTSSLKDSSHSWGATELYNRFTSIENGALYKTGGTINGPFKVSGNPIQAYMYGSNHHAAAITFDKEGSYAAGIGSDGNMIIRFGPVVGMSDPTWVDNNSITWDFRGTVKGTSVYGAVFNDYADSIEVNEDCNLEPGYCYCFDGEKYYKSSKYLDEGIIGIHSNTYGFNTGQKGRCKEMDVAVSGFVLAYVDKIYKPGTPLTCAKNGYLTEIKMEDKIKYPEKIVGTFWKEEKDEIWMPGVKDLKVKGRHWVKIR